MTRLAQEAVRQAKSVLTKFKVESAPIPIEQIARARGIAVQHLPLDDELSGMSFIKNGISVIVVNAAHHPNRQRFTIAHELGHHIMHADYLLDNVHVDKAVLHRNSRSSDGVDTKEIEANAFAAEVLMPTSLMRSYKDLDINDERKLASVAKHFRVSVSAMIIRILNLS
ncbi:MULTISPECIES: ImmA/IrrE family metallo-endopeptidase [unclassified Sphingomonas]|jgi:Zn-dependent peptidase ImmA (M78 family)|uniref:ImmA/IrrE family metallo-endopeptidase n=1 Tax=unclassified Sphingomonas TaxID=196159 RepID=UPI0009EB3A85|nr:MULTISPECIES: ImmA/IrrE family metallo-endopeptidase [unclassified Sphingomonas]